MKLIFSQVTKSLKIIYFISLTWRVLKKKGYTTVFGKNWVHKHFAKFAGKCLLI